MENIFIGNNMMSYYQQMEEDKKKNDLPAFLKKLTEEAISKEEILQDTFKDEESVFVHLRDQEILGIRLGSLEFCKELLEDVKWKTVELEEVDKMVNNLDVNSEIY